MTKKETIQKIKAILAKDSRFKNVKFHIKFKEKKEEYTISIEH